MLTKRVIGTVIIKNNLAVQSMGYSHYLPIGKPEYLIENLDRWGVDEIIILDIDRSKRDLGPNFKFIKKLETIKCKTPLAYGGGITSVKEGIDLINAGVERIVIDHLLHSNLNIVKDLSHVLGSQAIIGSLPLEIINNHLFWFNYKTKKSTKLNVKIDLKKFNNFLSELIVIDYKNEGSKGNFNFNLLKYFKEINYFSLIAFGGITELEQMKKLFSMDIINAIAIGNSLNYKEHAIQNIKQKLSLTMIRPHKYYSSFDGNN
jgi:imidazole glycerol-phosphate synthase subunit HisF